MDLLRHIGCCIADLRTKSGMRQAELAHRAGVSPRQLSRIETGNNSNPAVKTLDAIAGVLGVSISALLPPLDTGGERTALLAEAARDLSDADLALLTALVKAVSRARLCVAPIIDDVLVAELKRLAGSGTTPP